MNGRCIAVMGYKGAEDTIARHFENWRGIGPDLIGMNGRDGTIWPQGMNYSIQVGEPGHDGMESILRITKFLSLLADRYDQICVIEYDQLVLRDPFRQIREDMENSFYCQVAPNNDDGFESPFFCLPPWIFDKPALMTILSTAHRLIANERIERGYYDRFLGLCCRESGIKPKNIQGSVYIGTGPETSISNVKKNLAHLSFVHGVKTKVQYDFLMA